MAAGRGDGCGVRSMTRMMFGPHLLVFLILPFCWCADDHFKDITKQVFKNYTGYLAAFADFNSDKAIDVFVLIDPDKDGGFRQLDLNTALVSRFTEEKFNRSTLLEKFSTAIDAVMPADFNGDRIQDILIYSKKASKIIIYWGTGDYKNINNLINMTNPHSIENVGAEPLLFDFDGDRIVDILTSEAGVAGSRVVYQCTPMGFSCDVRNLSNDSKVSDQISEFHSNSFVDLNEDLNPDILISTDTHFEVWIWEQISVWKYSKKRPYPNGARIDDVGQSLFVDFDSSGKLSHLMQAPNSVGSKSIYVWVVDGDKSRWEEVYRTNKSDDFWQDKTYQNKVNAMMSLKSADLDQDGYPDLMTIVKLDNNKRGILSLLNRKCSDNTKLCVNGRKLEEATNPGDLGSQPSVTNLGFFDVHENGRMDVLISVGSLDSGNWSIVALENTYVEDACFIKVITVSGLCSKDKCMGKIGNTVEYGYNQPGAVVTYSITDAETKKRQSTAAQLYQTSHGSLQLPYILFGIGLSPSFVESLEVRMPGLNQSHQWTQIIPNSQMLVIPNPKFDPSQWQNKLFITPSRKMLVTGITLFGVVVVNVIIILVLHLMEKKADRIERQQQAHRFNFEAM